MDATLKELVDELPTQSLEMFVQAYEVGMVGGFQSCSKWSRGWAKGDCLCPRAALGFPLIFPATANDLLNGHPAYAVEYRALTTHFDTAELYSECVLAIQERDAALTPEREAVEV